MSSMVAEQVKFSELKSGTAFYLVNPQTVKSPAFPQVHYTCENLDSDTPVWVLYSGYLRINPHIR